VLDMIEIGAGGGSIAGVDPLGLVTVGPQSAGSEPGPVCYGRGGTRATVTDADLVLGYLGADSFLGGSMPLDLDAAREAIRTQVAEPMGIDVEQAAWGIHATVNENMANAARVHAVERGQDVTRLPLFASGGNGPLHGPGLARALGSPSVLVPPAAGVLSALGFLSAPLSIDLVQSAHARLGELTADRALARLQQLRTEAEKVLTESGVPAGEITHEHGCDMRFVGQGTETSVTVPAQGDDWVERAEAAFRAAYEARFGNAAPRGVEVEILTWRVNARGRDPEARLRFSGHGDGASLTGSRRAWFPGQGYVDAEVHDRYRLRPGAELAGPALVEERESTLVVPPGARCTVGHDGAILLVLEPEDAR
jgi:N-methylhydantoinase A